MSRLLPLVCLFLATQLWYSVVCENSDTLYVEGDWLGKDHVFTAAMVATDPKKCLVLHNEEEYEVYPKINHPRMKHYDWIRSCTFELTDVQREDAGNWTIQAFGREAPKNDRSNDEDDEIDESVLVGSVHYQFEIYNASEEVSDDPKTSPPQPDPEVLPTGDLKTIDSYVGERTKFVPIYTFGDVVKCIAVHNDESYYEIHPNLNLTNVEYKDKRYCGFEFIETELKHMGYWKTLTYLEVPERKNTDPDDMIRTLRLATLPYILFVKEKTTESPRLPEAQIVQGKIDDVTEFEPVYNYGHITRCGVIHNDKTYYEIYPKSTSPDIERTDENYCGFKILHTELSHGGNWTTLTYLRRPAEQKDDPDDTIGTDLIETLTYILNIKQKTPDTPEEPEKPTEEPTEPTTEKKTEPTTAKVTTQPPTTTTTAPIPVVEDDAHVGDYITFRTEFTGDKVKKCIAVHDGVTYEIYPNLNLSNAEYSRYNGHCAFSLYHIEWSHIGTWTITGDIENEDWDGSVKTVQKSIIYELNVHETVYAQPAQTVTMNSGYASFYIPKTFDNPTSCRLEWDEDTYWELINNDVDPEEGIELYKTCGVRMRVDKSRVGSWVLRQSRGDYTQVNAKFSIKWADDDSGVPTKHYLFWNRGEKGEINIDTYNTVYCDLVRPDGFVISLTERSCKFTQDEVTDAHAGVWKGRRGLPSSMKLIEEEYIVEVWNPEAVEISVTTEGERINMLCRTGLPSLNSCTFQMPNGTILSVRAAMGDGKYAYYGTGFIKEIFDELPKKADCGLTVRSPSQEDYGLWKCSMRRGEEVRQGLIDVPNPNERDVRGINVSTSAVYVKRGNEFTIKCSTNVPLSYCWLQSPNGTVYSVTKSGSGENSLRYNGEGLSMGVCGAVVENADDTDNGDWSCRLGVVADAEVESIVPVTVTESELISLSKKVVVVCGKSTTLSCRTFPTTDATIDYCRWVGPSGHGITVDTLPRYTPSNDENTCQLKLHEVTSADIGTWTCYARLTKASDEEVWSKLQVEFQTVQLRVTNTALNALAITLLLTTIVGACFLGLTFYRRKVSRNSSPPPSYDAEYCVKDIPDTKVNQYVKF